LCYSSAQGASAVGDADSRIVESVSKDCCVNIARDEADGASILEEIRVIGVLEGWEDAGDRKLIYLDAVVVDDCIVSVG